MLAEDAPRAFMCGTRLSCSRIPGEEEHASFTDERPHGGANAIVDVAWHVARYVRFTCNGLGRMDAEFERQRICAQHGLLLKWRRLLGLGRSVGGRPCLPVQEAAHSGDPFEGAQ